MNAITLTEAELHRLQQLSDSLNTLTFLLSSGTTAANAERALSWLHIADDVLSGLLDNIEARHLTRLEGAA